MGRKIFFAFHFVVGFLLLWLIYQLMHHNLLPDENPPLWAEALVETAYLVSGVIWGNIGWDTFKHIPEDASFSLMTYVLSRTLAPVAIGLPFFLVLLDVFYQGKYALWQLALNWQNAGLLAIALITALIQRAYRRSEKGFFYAAWRA